MRQKKKNRQTRDSQVIDIEAAREERKLKRSETAAKKEKPKKKEAISGRRATVRARNRLVVMLVIIGILLIASTSIYNALHLKMQEKQVAERKAELQQEKEKLTNELTQINSMEYIEQQARSQLHMIKPGEILYVMEQSEKAGDADANSGEINVTVKDASSTPGIVPSDTKLKVDTESSTR